MLSTILIVGAVIAAAISFFIFNRTRHALQPSIRRSGLAASLLVAGIAVALLADGGYLLWFFRHPAPVSTRQNFFQGATYPLIVTGTAIMANSVFLFDSMRHALQPLIRWLGLVASLLIACIAVALLGGGGYLFWFYHRPVPEPTRQMLFEGVMYIREVRTDPRPMVIHVMLVDLTVPGIEFLVTPGQPPVSVSDTNGRLPARTTSQFLKEFGVQAAINGGDFEPWRAVTPWDYYPHVGDPVNVIGFTSSRGIVYSTSHPEVPTLYISSDNKASFQRPIGPVHNAVSGLSMILQNGRWIGPRRGPDTRALEPRTAVALDKDARTLILVVVDGRQPNYSEGATLPELAAIAQQYGADSAMNQDGGGSSTLVMQGPAGEPVVLNSPIDGYLPGRERAIGNQLGIFARPLTP